MATKNTCKCPHPPGGTVACEPEQMAICRVRDGVAEGECIDPPPGMQSVAKLSPSDAARYYNWALQHISGRHRDPWDQITPADEAILRGGVYHNLSTGEEVTFNLPGELNLPSPTSATGSSSNPGGAAPSGAVPSDASSGGAAATY